MASRWQPALIASENQGTMFFRHAAELPMIAITPGLFRV
jgi:hypothetical protein